jgi:hypothetical protein
LPSEFASLDLDRFLPPKVPRLFIRHHFLRIDLPVEQTPFGVDGF